jgi:UDP-glucose 4-epimerase
MERVLVTGGAGFIGSHLIGSLIENHTVVVLDDLSTGKIENLEKQASNERLIFIEGSINSDEVLERALNEVTTVFHFAAQPDVRLSNQMPLLDFGVNVTGGLALLEVMRKNDTNRIVFASSGGTIYGDAKAMPTPEDSPPRPISNYGAAKAAFEMYLSSYSSLYGIDALSLRLGNVIGPRLSHGVIFDFYEKLRANSKELEVLGDGNQEKVYIHVDDVVTATLLLTRKMGPGFLPINVGSRDRLRVSQIVEILLERLGLSHTKVKYTGSKRGWTGDVIRTDMDISLLESYGWTTKFSAKEAVLSQVEWLLEEYGPVD